jgi:arginyl-tRNA synthetase
MKSLFVNDKKFLQVEIADLIYKSLKEYEKHISKSDIIDYLEYPPKKDMGDISLPCFKLSKTIKKSPVEISNFIKKNIKEKDLKFVKKIEIAGGFLNFFIKWQKVANTIFNSVINGDFFENTKTKKTIMLEYSQPNTHKEFHIGHIRNICLGCSISKILKNIGHEVISVNYIGDQGTHIAKCLYSMNNFKFDMKDGENKSKWLGKHYSNTNNLINSNENKKKIETQLSNILSQLENKKGDYHNLWLKTRKWSLDDFADIYNLFDIKFDDVFFESDLNESSRNIVDKFYKKNIFIKDKGAIGIDLKDLGFFMLRKSDGNSLYGTKDLALAKEKKLKYSFDISIYIVASEQEFYFKQVFATLNKIGLKSNYHHLSYGMITRAEGKMSSRKGNNISAYDLKESIDKSLEPYLKKYKNKFSKEKILHIRNKISLASIKYSMLSTDPVKNIVFDANDWTNFEGNTGPYLLYTYVRANAIAKFFENKKINFDLLEDKLEEEIIFYIYEFKNVVEKAADEYKPSYICNYLFKFSKIFNRYYNNISILKIENEKLRSSRIFLTKCFSLVLKKGLDLLGIDIVEFM